MITTYDEGLLQLDRLVFSSHKTSTQTLTHSLNSAGFTCRHAHSLHNLGMKKGDFRSYLNAYRQENGYPLTIYSVFREPISRLVSSFFQHQGTDAVLMGRVPSYEQSIITTESASALNDKFISALNTKRFLSYDESIDVILDETGLNYDHLRYIPETIEASLRTDLLNLVLLRYDLLINSYPETLKKLARPDSEVRIENQSSNKWYADKYHEFRSSLSLPQEVVERLYDDKRGLIDLFYPGEYNQLLAAAVEKYC